MKIERILIEDQMAPIGLDEKKTAFSWPVSYTHLTLPTT